MIRVAIVEDELIVQTQLKKYLTKFMEEYHVEFDIAIFADGDEILEDYRAIYDIIFLDIQMKRMDGMTAAKRIRELDKEVLLVFITNMSQYAIQGYSVNAIGFVLKPINYFTFQQELNRVISQINRNPKAYLNISYEGGLLRINVADITFIESNGHKITIHTITKEYVITDSMRNMEQKLEEYDFYRCNNCYIVNLAHVKGVHKNTALVGEKELQISRPKKKAFMDALAEYIGGIT